MVCTAAKPKSEKAKWCRALETIRQSLYQGILEALRIQIAGCCVCCPYSVRHGIKVEMGSPFMRHALFLARKGRDLS